MKIKRSNLKRSFASQKGFTIIELITASITLGILAGLGIQNFSGIKSQALYSVITQTLGYADKASAAALTDPDAVFNDVSGYTQTTQGVLTDADARAVLPGFTLSQNLKLYLSFDSTCEDDSCIALSIIARHCQGTQYSTYSKNGYGEEITLERIPGDGCP